jgi:hypothetical protein
MVWSNVATGTYTLTAKARDDSGLVSTSAPVVITVVPGNSPPLLTGPTDQTVPEDQALAGLVFSLWDNETAAGDLKVSGRSSNPTLVPDQNLALGGAGTNRTLSLTPLPDQYGESTVTLTVTDGDGSSSSSSFVLTVLPVNDPPSFTKGPDPVVDANCGPVSVAGWAAGLSPGPANEAGQRLTFVATNDASSLFAVQPAISAEGILSFTPAANASGAAVVGVALKDDGGTANGGVDTSAAQSFRITIQPAITNHPPELAPLGDTNLFPGQTLRFAAKATDPDQPPQTLTFRLGSGAPAGATVEAGSGVFEWTPQAAGAHPITLVVRDDGTPPLSASRTFTVTVLDPSLSVAITEPADRTIFLTGDPIRVCAAASSPAREIVRVEFRAGDILLGESQAAPWCFTWPDAAPGNYFLTATAYDASGRKAVSQPVRVSVGNPCGAVAVVGAAAGEELERVGEALFELGIPSRVFPREEASVAALTNYPVVLWLEDGSRALNIPMVDLARRFYEGGGSIYFLGPGVVTSARGLDATTRAAWEGLAHLREASGLVCGSEVLVERSEVYPGIHHGEAGTVANFTLGTVPAPAVVAVGHPDEAVLARAGGCELAVAFADTSQSSFHRTFAQAFGLGSAGAADRSIAERKRLFQNAVLWLLHCGCADLSLNLFAADGTPSQLKVGEEFSYKLVIQHGGECGGLGVRLVDQLPAGLTFAGAASRKGSWYAVTNAGRVTFELGRFESAQLEEVEVSARAVQPGVWTNSFWVGALQAESRTNEWVFEVTGLRLSIEQNPSGNLTIGMQAHGGSRVALEIAEVVAPGPLTWTVLGTQALTNGRAAFEIPVDRTAKHRFFRGRLSP